MLSTRPYLIRAFYEWIVDSSCTPYLLVDATSPRCKMPREFMENGQITLNISPKAIRDLEITRDVIRFRASFSGVVHILSAPVQAVLAIYAQENQQGMFFDAEDDNTATDADESEELTDWADNMVSGNPPARQTSMSSSKKNISHLRLVEAKQDGTSS
jgi:stringent starvation protein B